jgi:GINS complex subunit 3
MDDDYYSIDSILAENQKIQCSFKVHVPDMGHLAGGNERDVINNELTCVTVSYRA